MPAIPHHHASFSVGLETSATFLLTIFFLPHLLSFTVFAGTWTPQNSTLPMVGRSRTWDPSGTGMATQAPPPHSPPQLNGAAANAVQPTREPQAATPNGGRAHPHHTAMQAAMAPTLHSWDLTTHSTHTFLPVAFTWFPLPPCATPTHWLPLPSARLLASHFSPVRTAIQFLPFLQRRIRCCQVRGRAGDAGREINMNTLHTTCGTGTAPQAGQGHPPVRGWASHFPTAHSALPPASRPLPPPCHPAHHYPIPRPPPPRHPAPGICCARTLPTPHPHHLFGDVYAMRLTSFLLTFHHLSSWTRAVSLLACNRLEASCRLRTRGFGSYHTLLYPHNHRARTTLPFHNACYLVFASRGVCYRLARMDAGWTSVSHSMIPATRFKILCTRFSDLSDVYPSRARTLFAAFAAL